MRQPTTEEKLKVISDQIHELGHDFSLIVYNDKELLNFGTNRGTTAALMLVALREILKELEEEGGSILIAEIKEKLRELL